MISDLIPRVEYDIRCVEYDIRCDTKGITGHEAVTGDTGRARRWGIYTDRDHYSQKVTQGRTFVFKTQPLLWTTGHREKQKCLTVIAVFS